MSGGVLSIVALLDLIELQVREEEAVVDELYEEFFWGDTACIYILFWSQVR